MLIKVDVSCSGLDAGPAIPQIILKESGGGRSIPIMIGCAEANAIAIRSLDVTSERPLTIDMAGLILRELGGVLEKVVVYDLVNQVFYAHLYIATTRSVHLIDCRPSDAIALALRCNSPVFVEDSVFEKNENNAAATDTEKLAKRVKNMDTIDFGRYYLQ